MRIVQNSWYWTLSIFKYLLYFSSGVSASSDYNRVFFWGGGGSFRHSWKKDYDLGLMQKNACCALRHNKFTLMTLIITLWPLDRSKVLLLPTPDHEPWCHPLWPPTCSSNKTPLNIIWAVITFANRNNWMTPYTLNWRFWEHYTNLFCFVLPTEFDVISCEALFIQAKLRQGTISLQVNSTCSMWAASADGGPPPPPETDPHVCNRYVSRTLHVFMSVGHSCDSIWALCVAGTRQQKTRNVCWSPRSALFQEETIPHIKLTSIISSHQQNNAHHKSDLLKHSQVRGYICKKRCSLSSAQLKALKYCL